MLTTLVYSAAFLFSVLLNQGLVDAAARPMNQKLQDVLKQVKTMEDFKIPYSDEEILRRQILEDGYVVNTTVSTAAAVFLSPAGCSPYPTVVEIPLAPEDSFIYHPSHVLLSRCAGTCYSDPRSTHCVVKRQDEIKISVMQIPLSTRKRGLGITKRDYVDVKIMNHTECGVSCIAGSHMCEPGRTTWVQDHCRCECEVDLVNATCNHSIHLMDDTDCSCKCINQATTCTKTNEEWSEETCGCACAEQVVKRCKRKGKSLDENTCSCYCANTCPNGTTLDQSDCSCVPTQ